jgi:NAD/NADP transhydrogenase beta subunit
MKPVFEEPKNIIVSDLPTETGTIALTFPDDDIVVDDIVVDDIVVDDIVVDEDMVQADDDDANPTQLDNVDYSKIAGLVVLLVVMITIFVVFKKFKESGFDTGLKNKLKKKQQQQHTVKEIVAFDDKLHIDITTLTDDNN